MYPTQQQINEGVAAGNISINIEELRNDAIRRNHLAHNRLAQDPALAELLRLIGKNLLLSARAPIPEPFLIEGIVQTLIETITIWERTHDRFNEQFKTNP